MSEPTVTQSLQLETVKSFRSAGIHRIGGGDGEVRRHAGEERVESGAVSADLSKPQVVRRGQGERQEIRGEGVADRRGLPSGAVLLLGLLEVIRYRARVNAQQPDLTRRAGAIAPVCLQFCLKVLREAHADGLLGIAAGVQ